MALHDLGKIAPVEQLLRCDLEEHAHGAVDSGPLQGRQARLYVGGQLISHDEVQTGNSGRFSGLLRHGGAASSHTFAPPRGNTLALVCNSAIIKSSKGALQDWGPMRRKDRTVVDRWTIGYLRVSTAEQAQAGFSLSAQRGRLEAFAQATGREPIHDFLVDDGYSGSSLERPAMRDLLDRIERREVAAVLVTKLDRLSRNLRDILDLLDLCQRTGTALLSASESLDTSSAVGRMLVHLLGTFAEFERGRISERTAEVLQHRRRGGKVYCGSVPFGYRREGDILQAVPEEQLALSEMRRMHSVGATYRAIGQMLTERGIQPRGKQWYPASVRAILQSKISREAV